MEMCFLLVGVDTLWYRIEYCNTRYCMQSNSTGYRIIDNGKYIMSITYNIGKIMKK